VPQACHDGAMAPAPALALSRPLTIGMVLCSLAAVAACSSGVDEARVSARQACTAPGPTVPVGFDARTAEPALLGELAASAATRKARAEEAAGADPRWQALADAAGAISTFAGVLRDARAIGTDVDTAVTPAMWDQYKYASDAFVIECRAAL
jgi:hypothetical protein